MILCAIGSRKRAEQVETSGGHFPGSLERRQMPDVREYPEGRVWEKTAERLAQRRLMLDLITVADDDDGRNGDGLGPALTSSIMPRSVHSLLASGQGRTARRSRSNHPIRAD